MPHLTVEYTKGIQGISTVSALQVLNEVLMSSGQFEEADIKSRAFLLETFAVGTSPDPRGFVHAKLAILSGPSPEVKEALSQTLLRALSAICQSAGQYVQLCVEIVDIDRDSYSKTAYGALTVHSNRSRFTAQLN